MTTPKGTAIIRRLFDRLAELLRGVSPSRVNDMIRAAKNEEKQQKEAN